MAANPTILITGASGYIGTHLRKKLWESGYIIRTLTTNIQAADKQNNTFYWNPEKGEIDAVCFDGIDYIIHLAGANIGAGRWTKKRRAQIKDSRTKSTTLLFNCVTTMNIPLKAFITASATGFYGTDSVATIFNEDSPAGNDFLAEVCVAWEEQSKRFSDAGYRTVIIRTGVVLSQGAPALQKMLLPIKMGIGGPIGSGKQHIPWISLDDLCEIYFQAIIDESFIGVYNAVSPNTITNAELTRTLAKKYDKPYFFPPIPAWVLRIVLGEMSILITKGNPVLPQKLLKANYNFIHQNIGEVI